VLEVAVIIGALIAGAVAAVAGFGIGSILTPILSVQAGTSVAVAAVSVPHLVATFIRFWVLRRHVNRSVLLNFGLLSAAGGLTGALLHNAASNPLLTFVFAGLLIFAGATGVTGVARRMRFGRSTAWMAGLLSGLFGGLVGNQGGIRSAALLGFGLDRNQFVATATAIALLVDFARMPVYVATAGAEIAALSGVIVAATIAAAVGTLAGKKVLSRIPEMVFHRAVGGLILALGGFMLLQAILQSVSDR
jgi:uncharacterized membrane protein YfcA